MNCFRIFLFFCVIFLFAVSTSTVNAATKYWIGPEGGNFSDDTNWSTSSGGANDAIAPTSADAVIFSSGASTNATVNSTITVASVTLTSTYNKTLTLGSDIILTLNTLEINSGSAVKMGQNSKITITGSGTPLSGNGSLDTSTNIPNTVEYTGQRTTSITAAAPALAYNNLIIDPANFGRNSALTLQSGSNKIYSTVIDSNAGFAYLGTSTNPAKVVKVRLSDLTEVGVLTLSINSINAGVIDVNNGYAYFAGSIWGTPGKISKVSLADFTENNVLALPAGEINLAQNAVIDVANGFAYFGTYFAHPEKIIKVQLSDLTEVGTLTFNSTGEKWISSGVIDTTNGFAYFGTDTDPAIIIKVRLSDFSEVGALTLESGENEADASTIDTTNGFAYFATTGSPAKVVKVRLSDFTRVGALDLLDSAISSVPYSAVIDVSGGYAYFGLNKSPAIVTRVRLSNFTRDGVITVLAGENIIRSGAIDISNGFAYFGTDTTPGRLIRFGLGSATPSLGTSPGQTLNVLGNFTIGDGTNAMTVSGAINNPAITVAGNFIISANASFTSPATLSVAGNWANLGIFTHNFGTVILNGTDQTISGSTTFYNLTKDISLDMARTLTFTAGATQSIASLGTLTLKGGLDRLLSLRSSIDNSTWVFILDNSAIQAINYVDAKDSDASFGKLIAPANSQNSGNNLNWQFGGLSSASSSTNRTSSVISTTTKLTKEQAYLEMMRLKQQLITLIKLAIQMLEQQINSIG